MQVRCTGTALVMYHMKQNIYIREGLLEDVGLELNLKKALGGEEGKCLRRVIHSVTLTHCQTGGTVSGAGYSQVNKVDDYCFHEVKCLAWKGIKVKI